jgi:glycosyltransferase involved in cell wall biosynthesis
VNLRRIALSLDYHLFKKERALAGRVLPTRLRSYLRRRTRAGFLLWEARRYRAWISEHIRSRGAVYTREPEPGLFSVLTAVWNGSPTEYLTALANSIIGQNESGNCEWIILDNGCTNRELLKYLNSLKKYSWIRIHRSEENLGIVRGLRLCLEQATGKYVLPVDADDLLYPDCLRAVASWIHKTEFPPLLYTDEDKVVGSRALQPYLKPDFDPVLLLNSAYIAHLGVIEREAALELGAYSDTNVEGSADWDLFVRFLLAGKSAVHIPEIVYSWRMHSDSTAEDAVYKPYIASSQRAVLQRYLDCSGRAEDYPVERSPLLPDSVDWWLRPQRRNGLPVVCVVLTESPADYSDVQAASLPITSPPESLLELIAPVIEQDGFVGICRSTAPAGCGKRRD